MSTDGQQWDSEAWREKQAEAVQRCVEKAEAIALRKQQERWSKRRRRNGRDHMERAAEVEG